MSNTFGQMLKLWRKRLRLSQLELSIQSDISARHISFLETGRSVPSRQMVNKLASALSLSDEDTKLLIQHAGFSNPSTKESGHSRDEMALQIMLDKHEPYPGVISDYSLRPNFLNNSAVELFDIMDVDITQFTSIADAIFSDTGFKSCIVNWEEVSKVVLRLIRMKALSMQDDGQFNRDFSKVLQNFDIKKRWEADKNYIGNTDPIIPVVFGVNDYLLSFNVILSTFGTPRNVSLNEYQLEFFYPADDITQSFCYQHLA